MYFMNYTQFDFISVWIWRLNYLLIKVTLEKLLNDIQLLVYALNRLLLFIHMVIQLFAFQFEFLYSIYIILCKYQLYAIREFWLITFSGNTKLKLFLQFDFDVVEKHFWLDKKSTLDHVHNSIAIFMKVDRCNFFIEF